MGVLEKQPLVTRSVTGGVIGVLGELIAGYVRNRGSGSGIRAKTGGKGEGVSARRLLAFAIYGAAMSGGTLIAFDRNNVTRSYHCYCCFLRDLLPIYHPCSEDNIICQHLFYVVPLSLLLCLFLSLYSSVYRILLSLLLCLLLCLFLSLY